MVAIENIRDILEMSSIENISHWRLKINVRSLPYQKCPRTSHLRGFHPFKSASQSNDFDGCAAVGERRHPSIARFGSFPSQWVDAVAADRQSRRSHQHSEVSESEK
jgi:hypothetical protein